MCAQVYLELKLLKLELWEVSEVRFRSDLPKTTMYSVAESGLLACI